MSYRIPKTLDNPLRCLGMPLDTLLVFMMIWSAFVMFEVGLYGIVAGIISAGIFNRFSNRVSLRKLIRFSYWYFPLEMNFISGVKGHQRILSMSKKNRENRINRENKGNKGNGYNS